MFLEKKATLRGQEQASRARTPEDEATCNVGFLPVLAINCYLACSETEEHDSGNSASIRLALVETTFWAPKTLDLRSFWSLKICLDQSTITGT